jgi:hypothetical protein
MKVILVAEKIGNFPFLKNGLITKYKFYMILSIPVMFLGSKAAAGAFG